MINLQQKNPIRRKHTAMLVFFFLFSLLTVNAQINNNRFRVNLNSQDMGPCGGDNDGNSRISVLAKNSSVTNFQIAFDLPDGVSYIPGSERLLSQDGSGDFTLTVVDMSDLNAPVFRLERPGDANWQAADRVRFRFDKTASCDAVQLSYNGGLFKDEHTITYNDINGPQSASDNDPTINSYNFLSAYLAIQNYNAANTTIGGSVTRSLEVTNSGNGNTNSFTHNVVVGSGLTNYELAYNGTLLVPEITGNMYVYTVNLSEAPFAGTVGDGDEIFENETISFEESFLVQDCSDLDVSHQPTWGCSDTEICQEPMAFSGVVLVDTQTPTITITKINGPGRTALCGPTTYTANIANTATTGIAYDVEINTGFGSTAYVLTTPSQNGLWGNDFPNNTKSISNFRFSGQPSFTPDRKPVTDNPGVGNSIGSYFIPKDFFATDPDGPGGFDDLDGDGFFDDMAAGESTQLQYDYENDPLDLACGNTGADYIRGYQVLVDGYAQSQCAEYSATNRRFMNNTILRRGTVLRNVPTDVFQGQPFSVGLRGYLSTIGTDAVQCGGQRLFSADPNSIYTVTLNVPAGIVLSGSPANFTQVDTNTIVFSTSDLPEGNILDMEVEFPLELNCGDYTGPEDLVLNYTTRFECSCFAQDIACGSVDGIRAQCNGPCDGPQIRSFTARRETAGWTDDSMSTRVTLEPGTHNLRTYMAKDQMVLRARGRVNNSNPNNLFLEIDYTPEAGGMDIMDFVSGIITINDLSSPGTVSGDITIPPTVIDDGGGDYRIQLDLSSYTTLVGPTYSYGEPSSIGGPPELDEFDVELHYVLDEDFTAGEIFELRDFVAQFATYDALGDRIACSSRGERVRYFKNIIDPYDRNSTIVEGCREAYVETLIRSQSVGADLFPDEYRPPFILKSTTVEIPVGAVFTGQVQGIDYPGTDPSTDNGGLIATQVGNTIVITPGPSLREYDQGIIHYPRLRTYFQAGAGSPASTPISWTTIYEEYSYSTEPADGSETQTQPFEFNPPSYTLTTTTPIVSGDQATANFDVELCMTSPSIVDYNWLQITNGADFTVLNAYEVEGGVETPINFTSDNGVTWIEAGQLTNGTNVCKTIRFEIDFVQCNNFNFSVENAWDCSGYPSDFSTAPYDETIQLELEPKEAALQISIVGQPSSTVDVCSDFNIDVELRNAGNGDLITPSLRFDIPGDNTSLNLNGITAEYPRNSGNIQDLSFTMSGNTVTINLLDHTVMAGFNGIQGTLNANSLDDQIAIIQLNLNVQCNFTSNTAITYIAEGRNNCGTASTGSGSRLSTNPIVVTGASANYDAISALTVPASGIFTGCETETITVETTIVGGPTSDSDYARIVLPDGLMFDASTFVSNNPTYPVVYNSVSIVGNHEEIIVNMPDGADNGAVPSYSFDLTPKNTSDACSPNARIAVFNYVVTDALTCGSVSCGATETIAGDTFENVSIIKSELTESSFESSSFYIADGAGNYDYQIRIGIENTGTIDIDSGFEYSIYCLDTSGSKRGAPIFTGAISQAVPAGDSIIEEIIFTTTEFCGDNSPMVVEFVPSDTNCHCNILAVPLSSEPEPVGADLSLSKGLSATSSQNPGEGDIATFEITITNEGPLEATNVGIEDILPSGYTLGAINNGGVATGNTINWLIASVPVGTLTLTYDVTINAETGETDEYRNIAQVTASDLTDPDSIPNNDDGDQSEDDETNYTLGEDTVDIAITKNGDIATGNIGDSIVFTITAANNSLNDATNIGIEDVLPAGFELRTQTTTLGTYDELSSIWEIPVLAANTTATLEMSVIVTGIDSYTNIAELIYLDQIDNNPNNDRDEVSIEVSLNECLTVYNEFSPNGDGANEVFFIECIEQYPNNYLQVFNRWGTKVFDMNGYDNTWTGDSTGRATIGAEKKLPTGTYYYTLEPGDGQTEGKAGWLYISR